MAATVSAQRDRDEAPSIGEAARVTSVLDEIVAGVREDLAARERRTSLGEVEHAVPRRAPRPGRRGGAAAPGPLPRRRGQAGQPEQGPAVRHPGPRRAGGRLRGRRGARRSRCSPRGAASAAASTTWTRCGTPSRCRCCARTSSSPTTRCGRPGPTAPTSCCSSSRRSPTPSWRPARPRRELGMTALVEVHDEVETQRAVDAGASVVGRQRAQPQDPRDPPRHLLAAATAHPRRLRHGRRVRDRWAADAAAYAEQGRTPSSSARRSCAPGTQLVRGGDRGGRAGRRRSARPWLTHTAAARR